MTRSYPPIAHLEAEDRYVASLDALRALVHSTGSVTEAGSGQAQALLSSLPEVFRDIMRDAEHLLRVRGTSAYPEIVVQPDGYGDLELRCPECGSARVAERDTGERYNDLEILFRRTSIESHRLVAWQDDSSDFTTDGYFCRECVSELSLPGGLEVDDWI